VKDQRTFTIEDLYNSQAETGNDFCFLTHSPRLCSRRVSTHRPLIKGRQYVNLIEQRHLLAEDQFILYNTKKRKQFAPKRKMCRLLGCWSGELNNMLLETRWKTKRPKICRSAAGVIGRGKVKFIASRLTKRQ
jgi:hypothetical protein